ncbi:MAG TPA: prepilin peptidase [Candidatus Baltobacteraceae bacterium]|jgi:prepilin peptidase CpaA|nr:prepilin peptidase [Candidatus Baltobacteraceae bacterium]
MEQPVTIAAGLVLVAALAAAVCDVRTRRIPNALVGALLLAGIVANAFGGWKPVAVDVLLVAAVVIAGTFAFSLKLIGGGDVKLLAAAAGTLGYPACVFFILCTLVSGGLIAVAYAAMRGRLRATFANVQTMAIPVFAGVRPARPDGTPMPYALAIFAGALCTALVNSFAPHLRLLP